MRAGVWLLGPCLASVSCGGGEAASVGANEVVPTQTMEPGANSAPLPIPSGDEDMSAGSGGTTSDPAPSIGSEADCPEVVPPEFSPASEDGRVSCSELEAECRFEDTCCVCGNHPGCGTPFWLCQSTNRPGCPSEPPAAGAACGDEPIGCFYCRDGQIWAQTCFQGRWGGPVSRGCS